MTTPNWAALESPRQELYENVSFDFGILFVVEYSRFESVGSSVVVPYATWGNKNVSFLIPGKWVVLTVTSGGISTGITRNKNVSGRCFSTTRATQAQAGLEPRADAAHIDNCPTLPKSLVMRRAFFLFQEGRGC